MKKINNKGLVVVFFTKPRADILLQYKVRTLGLFTENHLFKTYTISIKITYIYNRINMLNTG